jgi:DNA-binding NtrC family response regulator
VADLSPRAQAKLLRVVQQQEVRRVGESFSRKVDVRFVSAANRDMRVEAGQGRFRQDLLYRLEVIRIRIPPLRERPEDIATLATHFWRDAAARVGTTAMLTHAAITALSRYHWPGNVRELQNVMAALAVAAPARGQVRPSLLPVEKMEELRRESLLVSMQQGIRDVRQGPDGLLDVLTDENDGAILRIEPADDGTTSTR